ncbi:hypothetical protein PCANB_000674 [Pneumocystis canis]|nr:hypothetical protein PCANB_000674 [Pneumocystis canis]
MSEINHKNRQELAHYTQRIEENRMKTHEEDLNDAFFVFSRSKLPIFQRNMTYHEMLKINPFFRENQIHYISDDSVLGLILVSVAVDKFNIIHAHVFSCCGPLSLPPINTEDQETLCIVVSHLPHTRRSQSFQIIAMVILQYFIFIPLSIKKEVLRQYNQSINDESQHKKIAFDEMHAGDIAGHCQLLKLSDLSSILCSVLQKRKSISFNIDVILPDSSESTPLFHKLQKMTIDECNSKDFPPKEEIVIHEPLMGNYKEHNEKRGIILNEILQTEENYINRLRHLVLDYVLPLRTLAKTSKNPPLGLYDINRIFPLSLNDIISVNSAFLQDFIQAKTEFEKANSCVTHFSRFKKVYTKYLELSVDFESILRHNLRNPKFRDFVNNQKYKARRNIGIRELIMEPVQRIPRYSLFLENIISHIHPKSLELVPFQKALSIIKDIAQMKIMEAEERSKLFQKLMGYVSGFPPELVSNSRYFITAIDAVEILPPFIDSSDRLYCTLLLFSDCLAILKKSSHISVANELISNERNTLLSKSQFKQNSFKLVTPTSRKDILFQGWANIDDLEIEIDDNNNTDMWIITQTPMKSYIGNKAWGNFPEHKLSIISESKHYIINFIEKFYKTKARNRTSKNFISEIEKNNINIICNVFKESEYKKEAKKSEIAIQYNHQTFINNINKKSLKMDISGLFLIEASPGMYRLDFHTSLSWKLSPQKFQSLDTLLENLFQKAISFQNFLKFSESPKNISLLISRYKFFLSCFLNSNSVSSSIKTIFPTISYPNSSNKCINSILENKQLSPKNLTVSYFFNSSASRIFTKRKESFLQFNSLIKSNSENYLSDFKNNSSISSLETIKYKHVFRGIQTFVYTLCCIEDFDSISTSIYSESELKDAVELSNEIAKNPQKTYAVLGSPLKISYAAFKHYIKTHVTKKIGPILPYEYIKSYLNIFDKSDPIDEKISKIHDISLSLPQENHGVLYLVIYLTLHVLNKAYEEKYMKVLLQMISESLVPSYNVSSFIPILKLMACNFSQIFSEFAKNSSTSTSATNSISSVSRGNSSQSEAASSFTSSIYDESFVLPNLYTLTSDINNNKNNNILPLTDSLSLNCIPEDTSKEVFHKNTNSKLSVDTIFPQSVSPKIIKPLQYSEEADSCCILGSDVNQECLKTSFLSSDDEYFESFNNNVEKKENFFRMSDNFKIDSVRENSNNKSNDLNNISWSQEYLTAIKYFSENNNSSGISKAILPSSSFNDKSNYSRNPSLEILLCSLKLKAPTSSQDNFVGFRTSTSECQINLKDNLIFSQDKSPKDQIPHKHLDKRIYDDTIKQNTLLHLR